MGKSPEHWLKNWNASRGTCRAASARSRGIHLLQFSGDNAPALKVTGETGERCGADEDREDALQGDGGRANEEAGLAPAGDEDRLGLRGRGAEVNHNDHGGGCGHGHDRVHNDAQRAMVGVGLIRVKVCDLGDGEQGYQGEAQHGCDRQKRRPAAMIAAGKCLKSCQPVTSTFLFY
jgi:hypothetical protein